ncbi:hypothetical protein C1645_812998 [Glomus cerebriforme]|uniref:Crinkler effector protein N-terminal domain-containing protein n=1 Tax=Glomus cerebriforme TaxID=658196 RepID=A0A397TT77_9GLOM|nr:hypothetical protein C1645_812998 [Glomus cerebriforme]
MTANAFAVNIDSEKLVSHLKKAIKMEKHKTFHSVEADEIKLWNMKIPDDQDNLLSSLILNDGGQTPCNKKNWRLLDQKTTKNPIYAKVTMISISTDQY